MRGPWPAALAFAALALTPARVIASQNDVEEEGKETLLLHAGYSYNWDASRITPAKVASSAKSRKNGGIFLLVTGSVAMTLGAGLMIGESAVKPRPGDVRVWSKTGCWISFVFGMALVPLGLHAAAAGIGMIARSKGHDKLASVMSMEGPGPTWMAWHSEGKGLRIAGNVMAIIGSGFLSLSLATSVPYLTCDRWECSAWPEVGEWQGSGGNPTGISPIIFAAVGAFLSTLGLTMMVAGYAMQARFLHDRHQQEIGQASGPIALTLSPTGLSLVW
ncbi:MAG: hypothetical protein JRG91_10540 [Deltaproteobacteria bacterium]|nr:hypothetical protein [Deltaproteobacteria bacterium]